MENVCMEKHLFHSTYSTKDKRVSESQPTLETIVSIVTPFLKWNYKLLIITKDNFVLTGTWSSLQINISKSPNT